MDIIGEMVANILYDNRDKWFHEIDLYNIVKNKFINKHTKEVINNWNIFRSGDGIEKFSLYLRLHQFCNVNINDHLTNLYRQNKNKDTRQLFKRYYNRILYLSYHEYDDFEYENMPSFIDQIDYIKMLTILSNNNDKFQNNNIYDEAMNMYLDGINLPLHLICMKPSNNLETIKSILQSYKRFEIENITNKETLTCLELANKYKNAFVLKLLYEDKIHQLEYVIEEKKIQLTIAEDQIRKYQLQRDIIDAKYNTEKNKKLMFVFVSIVLFGLNIYNQLL